MTIGDAAVGAVLGNAARELALHDVLQRRIQRQLEGGARGRRGGHAVKRVALGIGGHQRLAVFAANQIVVLQLDASQPAVVEPDIPEHARHQLPHRVEAAALLAQTDAVQLQVEHGRGFRGRYLPLDVRECAPLRQPFHQGGELLFGGGAALEHPTQLACRGFGIVDLGRDRKDRVGVGRRRQDTPFTVGDRAAQRRQRQDPRDLDPRLLGQVLVLVHLQPEEAGLHCRGPDPKDEGDDDEPPADRHTPGIGMGSVSHDLGPSEARRWNDRAARPAARARARRRRWDRAAPSSVARAR